MIEQKIKAIRQEITGSLLRDFDFKMNDVISLCESEIEKLLVLHLYNYFRNYRELDWISEYSDLEFIDDWIFLHDPAYDEEDRAILLKKIKKNNYRKTSSFYQKFVGFKVRNNFSEPVTDSSVKERKEMGLIGSVCQEFEILPQYNVNMNGEQFRLDIAVIMNRIADNKVIESKKVALECDGYDYHSSPEQKKNDDIRTRKLKQNGWKEVLRYSGRELYGLESQNEIHSIFKQIIDILYI